MNRNAVAWLCLSAALGLHVFDEAVTGFLPFYNDLMQGLRERFGSFPAPTFTFQGWLSGLVFGVAICFVLTPVVARGGSMARVLTSLFGLLMVANGLGHMLGSVYAGRLLPGFWSSPLLLPAAVWVVRRGLTGAWPAGDTEPSGITS